MTNELDQLRLALQDSQQMVKRLKERQPDWSSGDVVAAYADGSIVLDDGKTTWNPDRACKFLFQQSQESQQKNEWYGKRCNWLDDELEKSQQRVKELEAEVTDWKETANFEGAANNKRFAQLDEQGRRLVELGFRSDKQQAIIQQLAEALEKALNIPAMPFPDPEAHSWKAFAEAVWRAFRDIRSALKEMRQAASPWLRKEGEREK